MSDYVPQHGGQRGRAPRKPSAASKANNKKILVFVAIGVAVVVFIVAAVFFIKGSTTPSQTGSQGGSSAGSDSDASAMFALELKGTWEVDAITSYEFDGVGKGIMHTAIADYGFSYKADGFKLDIDFADTKVEDSQYSYAINGSQLIFTRWGVDYVMNKTAD